jgi:glycerol-3-phosphate acyltransferase PlsY
MIVNNYQVLLVSFLAIAGAYVVGSIPTGYLVARMRGIEDIRDHGSGNIGATNVARKLGLPFFFLVFFLDAGKAFAYLWIMQRIGMSGWVLAFIAGALLTGNCYSFFLGFRGGKGVATAVGIVAALNVSLVLICLSVWLLFLLVLKNVGIASVIAIGMLPLAAYFSGVALPNILLFIFIAGMVILRHLENITNYFFRN